jgi:hypothetical protein
MRNFLILGTILVIIFIVFSMAVNTSEAPHNQNPPATTNDPKATELGAEISGEVMVDTQTNNSN